MNYLFKFASVLTVVALSLTSCKNEDVENLNEESATAAKAKAIISLGCPNSPSPFNFKLNDNGDVIVDRDITLSAGNTYI
ncbi:MAG: hypothetical protein ACK5H1_06640, partial [Tenacibaculum sp.]